MVPPVAITNISIFNTPLDELTPADREEITPNSSSFANELVLDYNRNHFSIEFSSLSYANPSKNKYAYKLEGYDTDWQYTGASSRVANYNNLKSGLYTFHLKGSNENGLWNEQERVLQIRILPPPWKTTWAYTLYILLLSATVFVTYRVLKNRIREKQAQELQKMELVKTKEINHAKLQFFTNITHEFLTPLTILSASLDEMKVQAPQLDDFYKVMSDNINPFDTPVAANPGIPESRDRQPEAESIGSRPGYLRVEGSRSIPSADEEKENAVQLYLPTGYDYRVFRSGQAG